jgi:ParB-like chromosome segregation protein Spo0J
MERVDRFLDPLIAVRHEGSYWTPNGNHRLAATRALGGKTVLALLIPEPEDQLGIRVGVRQQQVDALVSATGSALAEHEGP